MKNKSQSKSPPRSATNAPSALRHAERTAIRASIRREAPHIAGPTADVVKTRALDLIDKAYKLGEAGNDHRAVDLTGLVANAEGFLMPAAIEILGFDDLQNPRVGFADRDALNKMGLHVLSQRYVRLYLRKVCAQAVQS